MSTDSRNFFVIRPAASILSSVIGGLGGCVGGVCAVNNFTYVVITSRPYLGLSAAPMNRTSSVAFELQNRRRSVHAAR